MDLLAPVRRFDRFQQTRRGFAIPLAVIKKFGDDQAGQLAALMAYYAFFSLFPLLLVMVTVLGFVLSGDVGAQRAVEKSVLGQFPIIGEQLQVHALRGQTIALVIGIAGALFAGLGVTQAAQNAFDRVWAVPFKDRPDFLRRRLRGLALLASLGALFLISTIATGLVTGGLGGPGLKAAGIALSLLFNFALFLASFRLLTSATIPTSCLWVGVITATVLWELLQVGGGIYVGHFLRHTTSTYGLFALVLGLLAWLHLGAQLTLYAAEINVVIARSLWPRSLFGSPAIAGDEDTLRALAKVEERSDREQIEVEFHPPERTSP